MFNLRKPDWNADAPASDGVPRYGHIFGSGAVLSVVFGVVVLYAYNAHQENIASQGWPAAKANIVNTRIDAHGDSSAPAYSPSIWYGYTVNGQRYVGSLRLAETANENAAKREISEATEDMSPDGAEFDVYYNPKHPDGAMLHRGDVTASLGMLVIWIAFFIGSVILTVIGVSMAARSREFQSR